MAPRYDAPVRRSVIAGLCVGAALLAGPGTAQESGKKAPEKPAPAADPGSAAIVGFGRA